MSISKHKSSLYVFNTKIKLLIILLVLASLILFPIKAEAKSDTENAGEILSAVIPAAAYGLTLKKDDAEGSVNLYKSLLSAIGFTYAGKIITSNSGLRDIGDAFPSEHTAIAFSGAAFMHRKYGWQYGIPSYTAASFVGWSSFSYDHEKTDDSLAGAVIGIYTAFYFTKPFKDMELEPVIENGVAGLALKKHW